MTIAINPVMVYAARFPLGFSPVWYLSRLLTKSCCLANIFQIQIRPKFPLSWLQIKLIWDECSFMSMMTFHSQNHRHLEVEEIINYLLLSSVSHVGNSGPEKVKVHRKSHRHRNNRNKCLSSSPVFSPECL